MWYHIRYIYNLLLTAFLIVGLVLFGLGGATIALLVIGTVFSVTQHLLGYDPLLTRDIVSRPIGFGLLSSMLGATLFFLGLGATHPKYVQKQR